VRLHALNDSNGEQEELILLSVMSLLTQNPAWVGELNASSEGRKIMEKLSAKIKGQIDESVTQRENPL